VLYVNLELDSSSCFHRVDEIYRRLGIEPKHPENLQIWNLRGHAVPMNRLAPLLIRRFKEKQYEAVVIDPIYKVITGDENNATEMSQFCSYFDQVATEMGVSMIYCHHHSKGAAGKYANAADRSSGSGVFARDPDAILDLSQLKTESNEEKYKEQYPDACEELTAWELSGTLREFPPMKFKRLWFDYPIHRLDVYNFLASANYADPGSGGTGKDQNDKEDWFEIAENIIALKSVDTCATVDEIGITKKNAQRVFNAKKTSWMTATLQDGTTVVSKVSSHVIYKGKEFKKGGSNNSRWMCEISSL
jgi:RecA-family ATPase